MAIIDSIKKRIQSAGNKFGFLSGDSTQLQSEVPVNMGVNKITNMAAGTAAFDAARFNQIIEAENVGGAYVVDTNIYISNDDPRLTFNDTDGTGALMLVQKSDITSRGEYINYVVQPSDILNGTKVFAGAANYAQGTGLPLMSGASGGDWTMAFWYKNNLASPAQSFDTLFHNSEGVSTDMQGVTIYHVTPGFPLVQVRYLDTGGSRSGVQKQLSMTQNVWFHVIITHKDSDDTTFIYIDNLEFNPSTPLLDDDKFTDVANTSNLFGATDENPQSGKCSMADLRVYSRIITAAERRDIFNGGAGTHDITGSLGTSLEARWKLNEADVIATSIDDSGNGVNATVTGTLTRDSRGTPTSSSVISSEDGATTGERGIHTFGDLWGTTQVRGKTINLQVELDSTQPTVFRLGQPNGHLAIGDAMSAGNDVDKINNVAVNAGVVAYHDLTNETLDSYGLSIDTDITMLGSSFPDVDMFGSSVSLGIVDNFNHEGSVYGQQTILSQNGTGDLVDTTGGNSLVVSSSNRLFHNSTGTIDVAIAVEGTLGNLSTGTMNIAVGVFGSISNGSTGTITDAYSLWAMQPTNASGTITNMTGLLIDDHSGIGGTTSHNIYSVGTSSTNLFEGTIQAKTFIANDGSAGATGTITGASTVTVKDGIVTVIA